MQKKTPSRCPWVDLTKPDDVDYHDKEWGVPIHNDLLLFEFLTLEGAQAGLSWYTVLERGFKFVGSTICYAHMQATGMINDHVLGCFRRKEIIKEKTSVLSVLTVL
jgi:DNA-3-methyladenine glycosylase I